MAKKQKFAPEQEVDNHIEPESAQREAAETHAMQEAETEPKVIRNPSSFLEDTESGVQYKFDRRENAMRKKAPAGTINVDGEDVPFQVTSNKGWSKDEDHVIEYIWVAPPNGVYGFITLDYKVSAVEWAKDRHLVSGTGKANRDNPSRIGGEGEERRKEAFIKKIAEKKANQPAEATQDQAEVQ